MKRSEIRTRILEALGNNPDACITHLGHKVWGYSYGQVDGITKRLHRIAWQLFNGQIPVGLNVCHSCDEKACLNPNHLWLGTQADNIRDKCNKGRQARGTNHGMYGKSMSGETNGYSKLTNDAVSFIRSNYQRYSRSGWNLQTLAEKFNVDITTISLVIRGKTWNETV